MLMAFSTQLMKNGVRVSFMRVEATQGEEVGGEADAGRRASAAAIRRSPPRCRTAVESCAAGTNVRERHGQQPDRRPG